MAFSGYSALYSHPSPKDFEVLFFDMMRCLHMALASFLIMGEGYEA